MAENNNGGNEEDIKPNVDNDEIQAILEEFYGLKEGSLKQLQGYDDLNYRYMPRVNHNPFIESIWLHGYVLKITNSLDSKMDTLFEAQNEIMLFLREHNIPCPVPVKTVHGQYYIKEKFPRKITVQENKKEHIIRLLEFQPGTVLVNVPKSYPLFHRLGIFVATLNEVLKKFYHPFYKRYRSIWHLSSVPELKSMTHVIENYRRRQLVEKVIGQFEERVLSKCASFEKGMIHGDFNEHNILMSKSESGEWEVAAILDFGESYESYYLFELAISLCYMMLECKRYGLNPVVGAGHLLAGYLTTRKEFTVDYKLLKICISARICQSLVLGLKAFTLHPENTYVLDSQKMGWPLLEELWEISEQKLTEEWNASIHYYKNKT